MGHGVCNVLIPEAKARYNPARDLAYTWQSLVTVAFQGIDNPDRWDPMFSAYLKKVGVTPEDIVKVARAYGQFMASVKYDRSLTGMEEALSAAGVFQTHPAALMAFMARLGQVMTGAWFAVIRDLEGEFGLPLNDRMIVEHAESGAEYVGKRMASIPTPVVGGNLKEAA